jgi:hypothetical protein
MGDSMSTIINATTTNGVVIQPDNSGSLVLQTNNGTTALTISTAQDTTLAGKLTTASSGIQFSDASTQTAAASPYVLKNRIINGDMGIDQRNAGASVTLTAANFVYPVDRMFAFRASGTSGAIAQRVSSGITGGAYALRIQRNSGDTSTAALGWGQVIESYNCQNMAGNSVTLSFKARIGANFSGTSNQITARIGTGTGTDQSAANFYNNAWTGQSNTSNSITLTTSWVSYSVTISAGSSVNQLGILFFYTPVGTASTNDWFEITDVQLEVGSTATPFERRLYNQELANCQRYTYKVGSTSTYSGFGIGFASNTTSAYGLLFMPVTMRAKPTLTSSGNFRLSDTQTGYSASVSTPDSAVMTLNTIEIGFGATGLTQFRPYQFQANNDANAYLLLIAEL